MTMRLAGVLIFGMIVIAGWFRANASADNETQKPVDRRISVHVCTSEEINSFVRNREYTGDVKAARDSRLSFERPGLIVAVLVDEGDDVTAGQVLARIDVEQVVAQLSSVEAQLSQANAFLNELESGPRKETIAATRARLQSVDADTKRLQLDFDRFEKLIAQGAVSQERLDQTKYALAASVAQRDSVQKELDELLAGTRQEQLDAQRSAVRRLEAERKRLELDINDGTLIAPFDGQIAERFLDEGAVVDSGMPVVRIVEDKKLEAWIGIPPSATDSLANGKTYPARIGDRPVNLELVSLRKSLDPTTRTQNAVFSLDEAATSTAVPGQLVRVVLQQQVQTNGYLVPQTSLVPGPRGLWNLFVVSDDDRIEQRSVEVLYSLGESCVVDGTLTAGEHVVSDGVHRVVAGQQVTRVIGNQEASRDR